MALFYQNGKLKIPIIVRNIALKKSSSFQDMIVRQEIMRISASNVDEGVNQRIQYDLTTVRIKEDLEYFKWDYQTGVVSLNQKLDKPVNYVFELKATATDGGTPPMAAMPGQLCSTILGLRSSALPTGAQSTSSLPFGVGSQGIPMNMRSALEHHPSLSSFRRTSRAFTPPYAVPTLESPVGCGGLSLSGVRL